MCLLMTSLTEAAQHIYLDVIYRMFAFITLDND